MIYDLSDVNNKIERVKKAINRKEPDRIPIYDFFWSEFLDRWKKEKKLSPDTNIYYYYDMDLMVVSPNMDPKKKSCKIIEKCEDYTTWESGFGATMKKYDYAPMASYLDFSIKSSEDYERFEFDDPNCMARYQGTRQDIISGDGFTPQPSFMEAVEEARDKICIFGSICEGYEALWRMRGPEGVFMDLALYPERVKKFVNRIGDFMIEIGKRQIESEDIQGLFIWGDVAYRNGMLFSPKMWKEIFYPVVKRICTEIHKIGGLLVYHGCGDSRAILGDLVEAGIDAYQPLEVKAGMDVLKLKEKYGKSIAFMGNIDAQNVLAGQKEEIKKDLFSKLRAAIGGGYIPSSDHSIHSGISSGNYDYFIGLLKQYGNYPLKISC
jgi:uroporphyrinogen decarboxylase